MHGFISCLRDSDHSGAGRLKPEVDVRLGELVLQALALLHHIRRCTTGVLLSHDERLLSLAGILAGLTKVDGVSWLASDISFLNLARVPLGLPDLIVCLALRGDGLPSATVLQLEVVLLHTIPRILLPIGVALQSVYWRGLVHYGRV